MERELLADVEDADVDGIAVVDEADAVDLEGAEGVAVGVVGGAGVVDFAPAAEVGEGDLEFLDEDDERRRRCGEDDVLDDLL